MSSSVSPAVGLENVTAVYGHNSDRQSDSDSDAFLAALEEGLGRLTTRPDPGPEKNDELSAISETYGGEVGQQKVGIVGGEGASEAVESAGNEKTLEERLQSLYLEMTHYQIAWRIAQNVQRDVSQLMRGT